MSLLLLSTFNYLAASSGSGLCRILGNVGGCVDVLIYSAGVTERDGRALGYPVELLLAVTPGSGAVFIFAEPLVDETFTLFSRVAALVASATVGADFGRYNYYVLVRSPAAKAQGPSLSAALGVGFALATLGVSVREPIAVTGVLMPDGGIGPVGYLPEKVLALSTVVKRIFVPADSRATVLVNGTPLGIAEYGRALGVELLEVSGIDEILRQLGVGPLPAERSTEGPQTADRVILGLVDYLSVNMGKRLGEVATACGEEVASRIAAEVESSMSQPSGGSPAANPLRTLVRLMTLLEKVESTAWSCGIERGYADLNALANRALERIKSAESACLFYSRAASPSLVNIASLSTACWFLLDSWEEFNESMSALYVEKRVSGLIRSMLVADAVFVALDLLSREPLERVGQEVDPRRVQLLSDYAKAMADSFGDRIMSHERSAQVAVALKRYLQAGASLSTSNPALSLAYILKVLHEISLSAYYSQYGDSSAAVDTSRARAAAYAAITREPTIYVLIELGDSCLDPGGRPTDRLRFYLRASVLGLVLNYLVVRETTERRGHDWYWLFIPALVAVSSIAVALLLRRGRVFSSRTLRYLGLRRSALRHIRVVRR